MTMSMERQKSVKKSDLLWQSIAMLLCLILMLPVGRAAAADSVLIISIPGNGAHQKFISSFRAELSRILPDVNISAQPLDKYQPSHNNTLLVTLGSRAFREITDQPGTMFHALVSHELYKEYYLNDKDDKYHLVFNQPIGRTFRLHAIALPQSDDIGVLLGNSYPGLVKELHKEAGKFGKRMLIERVGDDFTESLSNLLSRVDSLLLLPDSTVINRKTINSLVLDSYHKQIPLLGYSKSLVKAGAMLALFSTPEQLGEDSALLVARIISGKRVAIHNYPEQFNVAVNYKLSRAYGISIPSEKELHDKIVAGKIK